MRVLIADDQDFIRRGLRAVLFEEKDIEVCAEAIEGRHAFAKSLEFRFGSTLLPLLRPDCPARPIIVCSANECLDDMVRVE
jgi:DNA-binding NarL/FixJ family response regulator